MKFEGEKAVVNLLWPKGNPKPTLLGLGIISASLSAVVPDPNCICNVVAFKKRVANLL